jgi:hypothetical protein
MAHDINTYTQGPCFKSGCLTTKTIVEICQDLETHFGEGYRFRPEAVSEGGIIWDDFPGKTGNMYKTCRFGIYQPKWPWITPTTFQEWQDTEDKQICNMKNNHCFLKAFDNAPAWTMREVEIFVHVFHKHGLQIYKKKGFPKV